MKPFTIILFLLLSTLGLSAQTNAITEQGDEVILFDDGTWQYKNPVEEEVEQIATNQHLFEKSDDATFLLKSKRNGIGFWVNPKQWKFGKATNNPEAEYEFELKDGDLYGMAITEGVEIPLLTLRNIALENGRSAAPDLQIVKQEFRKVNGLTVLHLLMNGTMQGIKFFYYGYYYSNSNGTTQLITYSTQNLYDVYENYCHELLNGLVEVDAK